MYLRGMSGLGRGCVKTSKRNSRWRKYSEEQLPNTRLWYAKELHRPFFTAASSAVPRWRFLIAFLHSLGHKRPLYGVEISLVSDDFRLSLVGDLD